jgi:hypothetical protein
VDSTFLGDTLRTVLKSLALVTLMELREVCGELLDEPGGGLAEGGLGGGILTTEDVEPVLAALGVGALETGTGGGVFVDAGLESGVDRDVDDLGTCGGARGGTRSGAARGSTAGSATGTAGSTASTTTVTTAMMTTTTVMVTTAVVMVVTEKSTVHLEHRNRTRVIGGQRCLIRCFCANTLMDTHEEE